MANRVINLQSLQRFSTIPNQLNKLKKRVVPQGRKRHAPEFPAVSGNIELDGLTRYEQDFFETCSWVKALFEKVHNDSLPNNTNFIKNKSEILVEKTTFYPYDFTLPLQPPIMQYIIDLDQINLKPHQRHFMLLLCKDKLDVYKNIIVLSTLQELQLVLKNSLECDEGFNEIPLDLSQVKIGTKVITKDNTVPQQWL
jgi:hypothetical protein